MSFSGGIQNSPFMLRLRQEREERAAWEKANPDVAAAWNEAAVFDRDFTEQRNYRLREEEFSRSIPKELHKSGVPERCIYALDDLRETDTLSAVKAFRDGGSTFLLLLGSAGTGKSVAASWALKDEILRCHECMEPWRIAFARASDLARLSQYDEEDQAWLRKLSGAKLLVIDDLGAEQTNSNWLAILDELVDERYSAYRKTILTTNLDAEKFKARYGERIADRIRHDGVVVDSGAKSLRRRLPLPALVKPT